MSELSPPENTAALDLMATELPQSGAVSATTTAARSANTKWSEEETLAILSWWDDSDNFRKYVHGIKSRAQDELSKLDALSMKTPQQVRDKCQNLEKSYKKAARLVLQMRAGIADPSERRSIADRILRRCPYYQRLEHIFGERPVAIPPFLNHLDAPAGSDPIHAFHMETSGDTSGSVRGANVLAGIDGDVESGMDGSLDGLSGRPAEECAELSEAIREREKGTKRRRRNEAEVAALIERNIRSGSLAPYEKELLNAAAAASTGAGAGAVNAVPTALQLRVLQQEWEQRARLMQVEWEARLREMEMHIGAVERRAEKEAEERRDLAKLEHAERMLEYQSRAEAARMENEMRLLERQEREKDAERRHELILKEIELRSRQ